MIKIDINCDMGESYGIYKLGDDEAIMPFITEANVACGFHASDPNHMRKAVELAKKCGVKIGAHFSLPDLNGFGRREFKVETEELTNAVIYQIGALKAFLDINDIELNHLKAHGALYGMASKDENIARSIADAAIHYKVPILGISNTKQEKICKFYNLQFKTEYFADLDYDPNGELIITRRHPYVDPELAAKKCLRLVLENRIECTNGKLIPMTAETICIHSDTPNAVEIAKSVYETMKPYLYASTERINQN